MKLNKSVAVLAVMMGLSTFGQAQNFMTNGLVAYYPFNGNANDACGNGNNATVNGATLTADRFGVEGKAMAFNGLNQYIQAPHKDYLNFPGGDFTIAFWAVLNDLSQIQYFIGKDMGPGVNYKWICMYFPGKGLGINIVIPPSVNGFYVADVNPATGMWHHLLFRKTAANYTIYLDGTAVLSGEGVISLANNNTAPLTIGQSEGGGYLNGKIDDVRIYNRALSNQEVQDLYYYEAPVKPFSDGLVAYYPFNGNANDESGSGNNGVVHGATLSTNRFGNSNSCYSFNGLTDYIGIPDAPSLNPTSFISVSAWIKPTAASTSCGIVSKFGADNSMKGQWVLGEAQRDQGSGFQFGFNADVVGTGQSSDGEAFFATPQVDGRWHHLTMTYDGAQVFLYEDGNVVASHPFVGNIEVYSQAVEIGRWYHGLNNGGNNYYFFGLIDDVRIYNRALSVAEVKALFDYEKFPLIQVPHQATATAQIVNGFVVGITINDPGYGYTNAPAVEIFGGSGNGATAKANVNNGIVTSITMTSAGLGYTNTPEVLIASPPFMPWLEIGVIQVQVTQHVVLGHKYILETSTNLLNWTQVGAEFTAQRELIKQVFDVTNTGRYFRLQEVP